MCTYRILEVLLLDEIKEKIRAKGTLINVENLISNGERWDLTGPRSARQMRILWWWGSLLKVRMR